jgi:hypothetical protein
MSIFNLFRRKKPIDRLLAFQKELDRCRDAFWKLRQHYYPLSKPAHSSLEYNLSNADKCLQVLISEEKVE